MESAPVPFRFIMLRTPRNRNTLAVLHRIVRQSGVPGVSPEIADDCPHDLSSRDILAFSFTTIDIDEVQKKLRKFNPGEGPLRIAGGPHPGADPEGCLAMGFDAVFAGEAEHTLPEFLRLWVQSPQRETVQPLWVPENPCDLDASPHADAQTPEFPFLEISRGCAHQCAFCQVPRLFGRRVRFRSPAVAAAGVAHAVAAGHRRIRCLTSDAFFYGGGSQDRVARALRELVSACRNAGAAYLMLGSFPSEVRPDRVTPDLLRILSDACANPTVVVGAQSGSDTVLRSMQRGHDVQDVVRAVTCIHDAGLVPHVDLLFSFPGETAADRRATIELGEWILSLPRSRLHLHAYLPLPGTPAWPAPPEKLEPETIARLRAWRLTQRVDGYWDHHIVQARKILEHRKKNRIRTQ